MKVNCGVVGCKRPGVTAGRCPYDGTIHHHGMVHYRCGFPKSSLEFLRGWYHLCEEHLAHVTVERQRWEVLDRVVRAHYAKYVSPNPEDAAYNTASREIDILIDALMEALS